MFWRTEYLLFYLHVYCDEYLFRAKTASKSGHVSGACSLDEHSIARSTRIVGSWFRDQYLKEEAG